MKRGHGMNIEREDRGSILLCGLCERLFDRLRFDVNGWWQCQRDRVVKATGLFVHFCKLLTYCNLQNVSFLLAISNEIFKIDCEHWTSSECSVPIVNHEITQEPPWNYPKLPQKNFGSFAIFRRKFLQKLFNFPFCGIRWPFLVSISKICFAVS